MVEHQGIAPCIPVWKTGVYLSTPMLEKIGVPCESRTHLRGFADHCLGCSANGTFNATEACKGQNAGRKLSPPPALLFASWRP